MQAEELFEYPCSECGRGMVQATHIHNYRAKIKGYPLVVDEAVIGVCDQCGVRSFAPEETKPWDALFLYRLSRSLPSFSHA